MSEAHLRLHVFERYLARVLGTLVIGVVLFMFVRFFFISPGRVNGPSMEPAFVDDQLFFVNKNIYLLRKPARFDVIQVIDPGSQKLILKRILGLPGEIVVIKRGKVFITPPDSTEAIELDESAYLGSSVYTKVVGQQGAQRYLVGRDYYFVVGDNRPNSIDSRIYGPVHRSVIVGRVTRSTR